MFGLMQAIALRSFNDCLRECGSLEQHMHGMLLQLSTKQGTLADLHKQQVAHLASMYGAAPSGVAVVVQQPNAATKAKIQEHQVRQVFSNATLSTTPLA
jgi:hypothetical protein